MKQLNLHLSKKQKIILIVCILIIIIGGIAGFISHNKYLKEQKIIQNTVETYNISGKEKVFMNGTVVPVKSEKLYSPENYGKVIKININNEQYVEKGTAIFTCEDEEKLKEIKFLKTQISRKKKELEFLDEESRKNVNSEIESLNNKIKELNESLYKTIYAPFDGNVYINDERSFENSNSYIAIIESKDFYVKAQVNERDSYKVKTNQTVQITTVANKQKYYGTISYISSRPYENNNEEQNFGSDSNMTKYKINIKLENQSNLKNGLNTQIVVLCGTDDKKVPYDALEIDGNKKYVYKVVGNKVYKTLVTVSGEKENFVIISKGLKENDVIVKSLVNKKIKDRQEVYINKVMDEL